ncbi:MAG: hypothetical protein ACKVOW_20180 [Chitinophagaceae bacterium]
MLERIDIQNGLIITNATSSKVPVMVARLGRATLRQINSIEMNLDKMNVEKIFTKVEMRPNPFSASITLEIASIQNKQVVVKMINGQGRICKLFGWYLLTGTNVTTLNELGSLQTGEYKIDILDNSGSTLLNVRLEKA